MRQISFPSFKIQFQRSQDLNVKFSQFSVQTHSSLKEPEMGISLYNLYLINYKVKLCTAKREAAVSRKSLHEVSIMSSL